MIDTYTDATAADGTERAPYVPEHEEAIKVLRGVGRDYVVGAMLNAGRRSDLQTVANKLTGGNFRGKPYRGREYFRGKPYRGREYFRG